jgi:hypothetical protein
MTISKTLSTLSLAGALVAAAVALSPSDAAAARAKSGHPVTVIIGGPGGPSKPKPKPAHPPMRPCRPSDHCRG